MRIGIFFGGRSKEREISLVGGRTVYDNLDRTLFKPVPIFIDSVGNFILLNWQYLYKGTIRDFYPISQGSNFSEYIESFQNTSSEVREDMIKRIGTKVYPNQLRTLIDFAFLTLHGTYGEDGTIQGVLEWYDIPYSGTGILGSSMSIDKLTQKKCLAYEGFPEIPYKTISYDRWAQGRGISDSYDILSSMSWKGDGGESRIYSVSDRADILEELKDSLGTKLVFKSIDQGSSIGVSVLDIDNISTTVTSGSSLQPDSSEYGSDMVVSQFVENVNKSFFVKELTLSRWSRLSDNEKKKFISEEIIDVKYGIGLPVRVGSSIIYRADDLLEYIDQYFSSGMISLHIRHINSQSSIIVERAIEGREFSCIVIEQEPGQPIALPPTELVHSNDYYDYRSKYLPGVSNKYTPMRVDKDTLDNIRQESERAFRVLGHEVFSRIDGFLGDDGVIYINDPNTTAGMNPSSFLFHQVAEIGLKPTEFLSFIIKASLDKHISQGRCDLSLVETIDYITGRVGSSEGQSRKKKVGIIFGGYTEERHISLESGRNVFNKLSCSRDYEPIPIFLSGTPDNHRIFILPINLVLKDNADDIHEILMGTIDNPDSKVSYIRDLVGVGVSSFGNSMIDEVKEIRYSDLKDIVEFVFLGLHGRPGEDGQIQEILESEGIPYNGSGPKASSLTINKYDTNQYLKSHGFKVPDQMLISKIDWLRSPEDVIDDIEKAYIYPIILKPVDEGCSSAVIKIKDRIQLGSYFSLIFRDGQEDESNSMINLGLSLGTEFPMKEEVLVEEWVTGNEASRFLEITGGFLTMIEEGKRKYKMFSPSESLASQSVLSLEEKFLAGEGQNITPARYDNDPRVNKEIDYKVKSELERVSRFLDLEGYARIDAFVRIYDNKSIEVIIIEVNTLPALTPATCIFHQSALEGYKPIDFISYIINYGEIRQKYNFVEGQIE